MTRTAPARVRSEAKLGLELHKKWKRGGTAVGVARAVQLSSGKAVSDATIKRMYSYFQRHQHDRLDKDGSDGSIPGRGYIAWLLWGGNSGRKWAEGEYKKIQGKKKNPISKPVKKIKEDLAKKTIYLIKVSLDDYRSEAWAQEMVTKEEDFEVVDNYDDNGEPIFKTSEYVLAVVPKKYLQDFEFLRRMQMEGKLEKLSFSSAARAWLENDQPLDWFNEQAQDRGYLTKDEYLFLVKVNNPVMTKKNILDEVKTNDEVLQLKSFIEGNGLKKQNPENKNIRKKRFTKDPEVWVKAKLLEMAILTALKASGEHGLSLRTLSEATLFIMGKKYDKTTVKSSLPMTILRVIDEWKDRKLDFVAHAEATSSSPAHSLMQRKPSFVYIIRSKGIEYLEQLKKEIVEALKIADETKDMDSLISLIKRQRPEKEEIEEDEEIEENPLKMSNPARNVANVEDVKKFCEMALEEFDEALGYNADYRKYISTNIAQWFRSNLFKGIMNSDRTQDYFIDLNEDNYEDVYFEHTGNYEWPDFVEKSIKEGKKIEFFYPRNGRYFIDFSMDHFADFFESGDFPANPSRVSYEQMIQLVLDWDKKDVKVSDETKIAEGEVVFKEYSDGVKWVLLTNKQAIENESRISRMGHCIGRIDRGRTSNSYIDKVVDGITRKLRKKDSRGKEGDLTSITENVKGYAFSLRDEENHPYVTCFYETHMYKDKPEQNQGYFSEIKGYKNCHINTITYHQVDKKDRKGIEKLGCHDLPKVNSNEKYVIDLIRDETIEDLTQCKHDTKLTSFCDDLTYLADFVTFEVVPDYTKVDLNDDFEEDLKRYILTNEEFERLNLSKLNLPYAAIYDEKFNEKTKLPPNLKVFSPMDFETFTLKELPDGFKVIGNLILDKDIEKVGDGVIVEGELFFTSDKKALADKIEAQTKKMTDVVLKQLKGRNRNPLEIIARGIDPRPVSNYDREELKLGIKTELEHTDDAIIASKIAKDHLDEDPHYYSKLVEMERGMKKSNPITPASEEYLDVVQKALGGVSSKIDAWIDENSGDILVGSMAFEEDRSFDDVLVRIKTSGRILQGESVDDSIRKFTEKLMKKIHNELVNYVTHKKSNPRPPQSPKIEKFMASVKAANIDYVILSVLKGAGLLGLPLTILNDQVFKVIDKKSNLTSEKSTLQAVLRRLKMFEKNGYASNRGIDENISKEKFKKLSRASTKLWRIEYKGNELLNQLNDMYILFRQQNIDIQNYEKLAQSIEEDVPEHRKKKNPIEYYNIEPSEYIDTLNKYLKNKKSNPSPAEEISLDKIEELILDSVDQALSHEYDIYNKDRRTDEYDKQKWLKKIRELWAKAVKWKIIYRKKWFENTPIDDGKLEDLQDRIDDKFQKWDRRGLKGTTNLWNNRGIETDKIIRNSRKSNPVPAGVDVKEFDSLVEKLKKRKDVDNPYALANWILKQKNPTSYEKLLKQLKAKGVDDPKALAAWIGRQKYGKEEFQRRAAAGRKKKKGG